MIRRTVFLLFAFACPLSGGPDTLAAQRPADGPAGAIALTEATVVDLETGRAIPDLTILIRDGRIEAVTSAAIALPDDARIIDARGTYVIPGLTDTHVHLVAPVVMGAARSRTDTIALLGAYVGHGITSVRDAGSIDPVGLVALRSSLDSVTLAAPRIRVSGVVNPEVVRRRGAADVLDLVRRYAAHGVDGIKIRNGLTNEEVSAVIAEADRVGIPAYGHTYDFRRERDPDFSMHAVMAGASGIMHVLGIAPVTERGFPAATDSSVDAHATWLAIATRWLRVDAGLQRQLIDSMVSRGAWLEPTLVTEDFIVSEAHYRAGVRDLILSIPFDTVRTWVPRLAGSALSDYRRAFQHMKQFVKRFHDAGGIVLAGSDLVPGPGVGLHDELRLLVSAGLTPAAALQAATSHAARALGWGEELGAVQAGRAADLVLLAGNPLENIENTRRIQAVVLRGRYLDRAALDRLLAAARAVTARASAEPAHSPE